MKTIAVAMALLAGCGGKVAPSHSPDRPCTVRQDYDLVLMQAQTAISCENVTVTTTHDLLETRQ